MDASKLPKELKRAYLARVVDGPVQPDHFRVETTPFDPAAAEVKDGQLLVLNNFISVDPSTRTLLEAPVQAASHGVMAVIRVGSVMGPRPAVATVIRSNVPDYKEGDVLWARVNYETYSVIPAAQVMKKIAPPTPSYPISYHIGPLGWIGMTAYFPLLDPANGNLQPGQTIFVSTAAGAVGQLVCQIARRIVGPSGRVVGSAGSDEKCKWLLEELKVDAAFNYKTRDTAEALAELCPDGIHVHYDNVGGEMLDAAMGKMVQGGRIIACGSASKYDGKAPSAGIPMKNTDLIVMKRLQIKGFIVVDYFADKPLVERFWTDMPKWVAEGSIKMKEDRRKGIESFPQAFCDLMNGKNDGKLMIEV
ncbi:hypothetical protein DFJ74DRAFT_657582 [Hyaloraphidium curvatum]|nr:hypothetical protein DFJ74DRAFT_657582 [Hyaloraphidium curvatum]